MSDQFVLIVILTLPFLISGVAIVSGNRTKLAKLRLQAEVLQAERGDSRQIDDRIAAMEDRIRVLERIVTENRSSLSLAHEIDALHGLAEPKVSVAASARVSS